jgi:hypothetical protein
LKLWELASWSSSYTQGGLIAASGGSESLYADRLSGLWFNQPPSATRQHFGLRVKPYCKPARQPAWINQGVHGQAGMPSLCRCYHMLKLGEPHGARAENAQPSSWK